jgi:hypothetical protein
VANAECSIVTETTKMTGFCAYSVSSAKVRTAKKVMFKSAVRVLHVMRALLD